MENHRLSLFIALVFGFFITALHGRIFSNNDFEKHRILEKQSELYKEFSKIRAKRSLHKRSSSAQVDELHATQFDLRNGTTHNQALIHWSGNNSKVIFVLTRKKESLYRGRISHSTLWRSTDYGETYSQENKKFDSNVLLKNYYICPTDKKKAVFIDNYGSDTRLWHTMDEGETYHQFPTNFSLDKIDFHPNQPDWLLGYDEINSKLWVSQDLGRTWVKLHDYVSKDRYFWGVQDWEGSDAEKVVHFEYRDISVMPQRLFTAKACFIPNCQRAPFQKMYDDLGKIDMESLNVQGKFIFVQKPGALQKLYVSYQRDPFVKSKFSGTAVEQEDFHIVSSDTGTVVVGVSHHDSACHLYFSDERGEKFLLSKANVRYFPRKIGDDWAVSVDIYEIKGVKGGFIMNTLESDKNNLTHITWDNGHNWQRLSMPLQDPDYYNDDDEEAQQAPCEGCRLNLHVLMTTTPRGYYAPMMLSKKSVPGLIIAHGSVGKTVEDLPHLFEVFISRDGGVSWWRTLSKRHLFNIADHGAMIVGVQMMFLTPVRKLWFSADLGQTWSAHAFSRDEKINVDGLLTEPGEYTHHFTLFGHRHFNDNWKLYALDFSSLVRRNCTYPDDFHNITMPMVPNSEDGCVLGMRQTVEVLRNGTTCLIGREYKRFSHTHICNCSISDYECDYGYGEKKGGCVPSNQEEERIDSVGEYEYDVITLTDEPCQEDGYKTVKSGFRKLPGDVCTNEVKETQARRVKCSDVTTHSPAHFGWFLTLVNESTEAPIHQHLHFTVDTDVEWLVTRQGSSTDVIEPTMISKGEIAVSPNQPGAYLVRASQLPSKKISKSIRVYFWFPLDKLKIHHPKVIEIGEEYDMHAVITLHNGLLGTPQLVGRVSYEWNSYLDSPSEPVVSNLTRMSNVHHKVGEYSLTLAATSPLNRKEANGFIHVLECVSKVELHLNSSIQLEPTILTSRWIRSAVLVTHAKLQALSSPLLEQLESTGFQPWSNMEVYIPPVTPIRPQLLFYSKDKTPTCDHLKQIADEYERLLRAGVCMEIGTDVKGQRAVICAQTAETSGVSGANGGTIAVVVMMVIAACLCALLLYRKFASTDQSCSPVYYRLTSTLSRNSGRATSGRRSHIVHRARQDDEDPIVDEDEFIDEELDGMETIGHTENGLGTLEFQSG